MASAPLNWLLKIGEDALNTTAKTISAAVNELNNALVAAVSRVSKTETDITSIKAQKADTTAVTNGLAKKVDTANILTLEEAAATTNFTNKVASAAAIKTLNSNLGGCGFSVENGAAYVSYNTGTETVKKKLGSSAARIFTSSPVNMKSYTDDWAKLTSADFKAGASYGSAYAKTSSDCFSSASAGASPTFSYNASTGVLTFSSINTTKYDGDEFYAQLQMTVFVVWLGTVGGKA